MKTKTIEFHATEFNTAHEAIQWANASGQGEAVLIHGRFPMVVDAKTLDMAHTAGLEFAYLHDHEMPDGAHRIVTVPVN